MPRWVGNGGDLFADAFNKGALLLEEEWDVCAQLQREGMQLLGVERMVEMLL